MLFPCDMRHVIIHSMVSATSLNRSSRPFSPSGCCVQARSMLKRKAFLSEDQKSPSRVGGLGENAERRMTWTSLLQLRSSCPFSPSGCCVQARSMLKRKAFPSEDQKSPVGPIIAPGLDLMGPQLKPASARSFCSRPRGCLLKNSLEGLSCIQDARSGIHGWVRNICAGGHFLEIYFHHLVGHPSPLASDIFRVFGDLQKVRGPARPQGAEVETTKRTLQSWNAKAM